MRPHDDVRYCKQPQVVRLQGGEGRELSGRLTLEAAPIELHERLAAPTLITLSERQRDSPALSTHLRPRVARPKHAQVDRQASEGVAQLRPVADGARAGALNEDDDGLGGGMGGGLRLRGRPQHASPQRGRPQCGRRLRR